LNSILVLRAKIAIMSDLNVCPCLNHPLDGP